MTELLNGRHFEGGAAGRPVLRGLWKQIFHASSIFSLLDPRNEDFHPQITFQRGARGGRHPMLVFWPIVKGKYGILVEKRP